MELPVVLLHEGVAGEESSQVAGSEFRVCVCVRSIFFPWWCVNAPQPTTTPRVSTAPDRSTHANSSFVWSINRWGEGPKGRCCWSRGEKRARARVRVPMPSKRRKPRKPTSVLIRVARKYFMLYILHLHSFRPGPQIIQTNQSTEDRIARPRASNAPIPPRPTSSFNSASRAANVSTPPPPT
jgi:hypothetical protein